MFKSSDKIFIELELLEQYAHVAPLKAVKIIERIEGFKKPFKTKIIHIKGFGKIKDKSHDDILLKCIATLNKIRYLETKKVFNLLVKLNLHSNEKITSESIKTLEHLSKYDLFVLRQVGYIVQKTILDELEHWGDQKIKKNIEVVFVIAREFLEPIFEGQSMPDYQTLQIQSGPLVVSDELKEIRKRTILIIERAYLLASTLNMKVKAIQVSRTATEPPHSHLYGDDVEQMIVEDTKAVIGFYLKILAEADNELIQDIEEQKIWLVKRFDKKLSEEIKELDEAIRSNASYDMFRVFVGYDGRLDPDYDFNRDRETRSKKIHEFIGKITETYFEQWREKILSVVKNYSATDPGGYGYFETFLIELGKKKSKFAILLLKNLKNDFNKNYI